MRVGLVLEGGAMRGMYTAGVIDALLEANVKVDEIIGVSAGALFGINFATNQKGRAIRYNTNYIKDKRYMGWYPLLKTGNIVSKDFAFGEIPLKLDKIDEEAFENSGINFYCVVTNVESGKAEYIKIDNTIKQMDAFRATSAMPFVSEIVEIDGKKYLDGGISDSIPIKKCRELGVNKIIVVLTRPIDYRKKNKVGSATIIDLKYKKYPNLVSTMKNRYLDYNKTVEDIIGMEDKGEIFVIRPTHSLNISRMDKNIDKIKEVYEEGIKDANDKMIDLIKYLGE